MPVKKRPPPKWLLNSGMHALGDFIDLALLVAVNKTGKPDPSRADIIREIERMAQCATVYVYDGWADGIRDGRSKHLRKFDIPKVDILWL